MTQRRAALYLRQSQYTDGSISEELQETTARAMCEREGWTVVGVYKDIDLSGRSTEKRTGLRALRAAFERGEFDLAVAHAASRFARNMQDGAEIVAEMPIATVLEGEAPSDDDFMPLLHMLLAHKQSKEIGKRWREVHAHKRAQGLPAQGGPRFGYRREGTMYTPDPVTGPVLREAYLRYARGEGWLSITTDLNTRGIKTTADGEWSTTVLRRVLDSGFGAGLIVSKKEHLPGAHEAVITEAQWSAYRAARTRRSKLAPRQQTPTWHLARIAVCAACGAGLTTQGTTKQTKDGRKQYRYATCPNRGNKGTCVGVAYKKERLDWQVAMWLGGHVTDWAAAMPDDSAERAVAAARLEAARRDLEQVDARLGRLATGWADGLLDDAGYRAARADADVAREAALTEIEDAREALTAFLLADADVYDRLTGQDLSVGEWHDLLRRIITRIEVSPEGVRVVPSRGEPSWLPNPGRATAERIPERGEDGRWLPDA